MNLSVEFRIGEGGVIQLVMAPTSVAVHLDKDIFPKLLAIFQSQSGHSDDVFRIVSIGVKDRRADQFAEIGTIPGK